MDWKVLAHLHMIFLFTKNLKIRYPDWDKEQIEKEIFKFAAPATNDPKKPPPHNTGGSIDLTIIDDMGNDPEMNQEFSQKARIYAEQKHDIKTIVEDYKKLFSKFK